MTYPPLQLVIVDDFDEDRAIIRRALRKGLDRHFICHEASNGEEALQVYAQTASDSPALDIMLLDLNLPDMNGLELLQELQGDRASLPFPVVVLTGAPREEEARAALAAGAQDFLAKSQLTPEALTRTVLNAIERFRLVKALQASEERSRRQLAELQAAERAEREQRRLAEALLDSLTALTGSLDVESVMQQLLACAATVVPSDAGSVILYEDGAGRVAYLRGFGPEATDFFKEYRFPLSTVTQGILAMPTDPYLIADTATLPQWLSLPVTTWIRSSIRIPIELHGAVIGVLIADSATPHQFQPADLEKLQAFAGYVSLALEKADHITKLEARVAARTADLRAAKERVEAILENSLDGILLVHADLRIEQTNPAFHRLFASQPEMYTDQTLLDLVPPAERTHVATVLQAAITAQEGKQLETRMQRSDGSVFAAELSIGYINQAGLVCSLRDITERKQAEEALHNQRDFLQLVINSVPNFIAVKDRAGCFQLINEKAAQLYGSTTSAMLGKTIADFHPNPADVALIQQQDQSVFASGQPVTTPEMANLGRYFHTSRTPLRNADGQVDRVLIVSFDITEQKQAETTLQQSLHKEQELGELKSRFISMASHEFRTPLAAIRATTDTLLTYRQRLPDEQIDRRLGKILGQVDYLKGIIEDVLQLARLQARRVAFMPVPIDLDHLCRTLIEELHGQEAGPARVLYQAADPLRTVMLDPKLMRQIIVNLLSNALKYSPDDKPVALTLGNRDGILVLQVRDEGIGIPAADLPHLYQPFHRAHNVGAIAGTGLGLTITKESVELQGGTLQVTSEVSVGTTFTVRIPLNGKRE